MIQNTLLDSVRRRAEALMKECDRRLGFPGVGAIQQRLDRALRLLDRNVEERPVAVALVGGTGAGKSELFNALIRRPQASPVSGAARLFTKRVHAAVLPTEAQWLALPPECEPVWVSEGVQGLALMDTPDLDGALPEHRERARLAIEAADIVVYVALPEKRSSFAITEELALWAAQKQWFFVLNKVDLCAPEDLGRIREDFASRVAELGFAASDSTLFLASAREPRHPYSEFERLRSAIYSSRTTEEMSHLKTLGVYRALGHAVGDQTLGDLSRLSEELIAAEHSLDEQVRAIYLRVLSSRTTRDHLTEIVRARVWREIPARVGGFLALPLWVVARANQLWLTVSLGRLVGGGFNLAGLAQTLWAAVIAYVRGVLPLQGLMAGFKPRDLGELKNLRRDAVRKLEDLGVDWDDEDAPLGPSGGDGIGGAADAAAIKRSGGEASGPIPPPDRMGSEARMDPERAQIMQCLMDAVDRSSSEASSRAVGWAHRFFGNLLPLVVFIDVARKAATYWLEDSWLPGHFYLLAVFLFILASAPGCFLVSAGVRARARIGRPEELIAGLDEPWESEPLRGARRALDRFRSRLSQFQRQMRSSSEDLSADLGPERFGARLNPEPSSVPNADSPSTGLAPRRNDGKDGDNFGGAPN